MSQQGLNVSEVINISTTIQAGGGGRSEFGTGLLMTISSGDNFSYNGADKVKRFTSYNDVLTVFNEKESPVVKDAAVWFAADPQPKPLYIGKFANNWSTSNITTGIINTPIDNGTYSCKINNKWLKLIINNTNGATLNTLASYLQTQIRANTNQSGGGLGYANSIVTHSNGRLYIQLYGATPDQEGIIYQVDIEKYGALTDKDLLKEFKLTREYGANIFIGGKKEDLKSAINSCIGYASGGEPTALMLDSQIYTTDENSTDLASFAQTGDYMCGLVSSRYNDTDKENKVTGDIFAESMDKSQSHVISIFDETDSRPDIAVLAKLSSQNFNLPESLVSLPPKTLAGVTTTQVNSDEIENLKSKRASVYTTVGGFPAFLGGYTSKDGVWADSQWWLLWLKNEMEREIFVSLRSSRRANASLLLDAINSVMGKAVRSGGAKPGGVVSDAIKHDIRAITGNHNFDGVLSTGYLVWIDPLQSQSQSDRENRIARFKVWIAPSEAIHTVDGAIVLSGG